MFYSVCVNFNLNSGSPSPPPTIRTEVREEPEKIKKWREEQIKRLEEKGEHIKYTYNVDLFLL